MWSGRAELPETVNRTYIDQAPYWLTYFPYVVVLLLRQSRRIAYNPL